RIDPPVRRGRPARSRGGGRAHRERLGRRLHVTPEDRRTCAETEGAAARADRISAGRAALRRCLGAVIAGSVALDRPNGRTVSFPGAEGSFCGTALRADVAQLVEQRFCKPPVPGSSPVVGSKCRCPGGGFTTGPQSRPIAFPCG